MSLVLHSVKTDVTTSFTAAKLKSLGNTEVICACYLASHDLYPPIVSVCGDGATEQDI